jgi:hypothetical protein
MEDDAKYRGRDALLSSSVMTGRGLRKSRGLAGSKSPLARLAMIAADARQKRIKQERLL